MCRNNYFPTLMSYNDIVIRCHDTCTQFPSIEDAGDITENDPVLVSTLCQLLARYQFLDAEASQSSSTVTQNLSLILAG